MSGIDFQQLVDRQYAPLFRFGLTLAKSEAEAADLTQQTFFLWASKGHQLRDRTKAKSWLFTTLYREFLNKRRHEVRFPHVELDDASEDDMSILPPARMLSRSPPGTSTADNFSVTARSNAIESLNHRSSKGSRRACASASEN